MNEIILKKYFAGSILTPSNICYECKMDSSAMWKLLIGYDFSNSNNFRYSFNVNEIIDYLVNVVHIEEPDITNFVYFGDESLVALCYPNDSGTICVNSRSYDYIYEMGSSLKRGEHTVFQLNSERGSISPSCLIQPKINEDSINPDI
ncbi:hypothetical protein GQX74_010139 [Glossina fuscipes]|nr:hypothetical protein GQX74_010139 [Glossina fuscipes]